MNYRKLFLLLPLFILFSCSKETGETEIVEEKTETQEVISEFGEITAIEVCKIVANNPDVVFLDVRTIEEFNGELGHFKNAVRVAITDLIEEFDKIENYMDDEVIVYCRSGRRSRKACEVLVYNGFKDVKNLKGGLLGWQAASTDSLECKNTLIKFETGI